MGETMGKAVTIIFPAKGNIPDPERPLVGVDPTTGENAYNMYQADAAGAMVEVQAPVDAEASAKTAGREPSPAAEAPGAGAPAEGAAVQATAPISAEQAQAFWRGKLVEHTVGNEFQVPGAVNVGLFAQEYSLDRY
jgi:hypothetical protein